MSTSDDPSPHDAQPPPRLRTARLTLREWRDEDVAPYTALCADPEVMRYIASGATLPAAAAAAQVERFRAPWRTEGFGLWAVEERDTGAFVGFAGLARPLFLPEVLPAVELGWRFARQFWGRGYATESGRAALDYGFDSMGLDRIIGIANDANTASWHVMTKLGMTLDRTTRHPRVDAPIRVYAISAETHRAR